MSFGQGLSGLNAAAQELDIIGNNIANSGTVGFKSASASFADVYANSKVGLGVQLTSVNQRFTVGTISGTGGQFDMAIDGPNGMFRLQDPDGNIMYSRNGQFFADKDNFIVNAQGQRLTGYALSGTDLVPIKVPIGNIEPQSTSAVTTKTNLDANATVVPSVSKPAEPAIPGTVTLTAVGGSAVTDTYYYLVDELSGKVQWMTTADPATAVPGNIPPAGDYTTGSTGASFAVDSLGAVSPAPAATGFPAGPGNIAFTPAVAAVIAVPFDPTNASSFSHSLPLSVYDSLGNAHQFIQYFAKREGDAVSGESSWDVYYRLDGKALAAPDMPIDGSTTMTFDSTGRLISDPAVDIRIAAPGGGASPAAALNMTLSYNDSTQFGGPFAPNFTQDGYSTGEYAGLSIGADGAIVANYTNDQTQLMGYIALAHFNNLQGLQPAGGTAWIETGASGQPILGRPGSNSLATIKGQALEESNVDISQELVKMIIAQRTYQSNAQAIKTQDQVLQSLISMR